MGQCQVRRVAMRRLNAARRCSDDHTTSHPPRHRRRQRRRQKHHLARTYEYPRRRDGHPRLHRRLSQVRPQRARRAMPHPAAPGVQLHRRHGTAPGVLALRPAHPQAGLRARHRHARPAGVRAAATLRPGRRLAGLLHADPAAILRRQGVSGAAGGSAEGVEAQARHHPARLHDPAGAGGTGAARARLARLHSPAARVCRRRGDVLSAGGLFAGGGGAKPERAVGAAAHDSSPGPQLPGSHRPRWSTATPARHPACGCTSPATRDARWTSWKSTATWPASTRPSWKTRCGSTCPTCGR